MRSRSWQALAVAGLTAFAVACGGDGAANGADSADGMADEAAEGAGGAEGGAETQAPVDLPEGLTMEMVDQGRQLFAGGGGCYACHGPEANGTQLAPDLHDDEWLNISGRDFDEIVGVIRAGVTAPVRHPAPMPPMGGANLGDAQIDALAAYIVSLGG